MKDKGIYLLETASYGPEITFYRVNHSHFRTFTKLPCMERKFGKICCLRSIPTRLNPRRTYVSGVKSLFFKRILQDQTSFFREKE